ncbi:hypothetical protein [Paraburkholderia sp. MM6662-R1]|uniref:hypothetical protein n=1 Tax=Paraburkholderia sp. MM6662-R1 TaxID=2991066 RepID=UPI003D19407B
MTDLQAKLAQHTLNIPCGNCGEKVAVTIGRLKEDNHLVCSGCGASTTVEHVEQMERDLIGAVEEQTAKIRALMSKLGK